MNTSSTNNLHCVYVVCHSLLVASFVLDVILVRPVRYRHRVSTEALDNNDDVLSSQEAFESDSLDPVGDNTDKGKVSLASLDNEVTGE
jgi:hypothetical protein